jgi:hypothetical protein
MEDDFLLAQISILHHAEKKDSRRLRLDLQIFQNFQVPSIIEMSKYLEKARGCRMARKITGYMEEES